MSRSYRTAWQEKIEERLRAKDGIPGILELVKKQGGRFIGYEHLTLPASLITMDLDTAIFIGCAFPEHRYFLIFLEWAKEAASRTLSDPRFDITPSGDDLSKGWKIHGTIYPGNHGMALVAACFANSLQVGIDLDQDAIRTACDEIAESALAGGSKMWDYIAQSDYLRCVRLCLTAGDVLKARFFLVNIRRKFKYTYVHQEWLQKLVNDLIAANGQPLPEQAQQHFQNFFDEVRDPDYQLPRNQPEGKNLSANLSLLRLELATIKQRFILRQPMAGHWREILALISE